MKFNTYWRVIIWLMVMCYLLFMPASQLPSKPFLNIPHFDKIVHFGMFFVLCLLLFRPVKQFTPNFYFWTPLLTLVFAVGMEFLQQKISISRSSDIYDLWANSAGLACATLFYRLLVHNKKVEIIF